MMRSLYSGVSGLKNHQTRMDVIGNNISNVNTVGFKASRVVFQDIYSQTAKNASAPGVTSGGTNPVQIGLGVTLAAIDVLHTSAATQRTDNPSDLAIEGDGFFVIQGSDQLMFTRAGNFYVDSAGNLVTTGGEYVMGVMLDRYQLTDDTDTNLPDKIRETIEDPNYEPDSLIMIGQDADGNDGYYWSIINPDYVEGGSEPKYIADLNRPFWVYDDTSVNAGGTPGLINNANLSLINLAGYEDIEFAEGTGLISGLLNGERVNIGYLAIATFTNNSGLKKMGSTQFSATPNSGEMTLSVPSSNGAGKINPGGLEMSNVDLAGEFTDMIITQRGFQANSRVITVSDTMLEELINLKR